MWLAETYIHMFSIEGWNDVIINWKKVQTSPIFLPVNVADEDEEDEPRPEAPTELEEVLEPKYISDLRLTSGVASFASFFSHFVQGIVAFVCWGFILYSGGRYAVLVFVPSVCLWIVMFWLLCSYDVFAKTALWCVFFPHWECKTLHRLMAWIRCWVWWREWDGRVWMWWLGAVEDGQTGESVNPSNCHGDSIYWWIPLRFCPSRLLTTC